MNNIFLFDGIGALLSTILTSFILPQYSEEIGLSKNLLYGFATLAFIYFIYSSYIFFLVSTKTKKNLLVIILANLFYCILSGLVIILSPTMTSLGQIILSLEVVVVLFVILLEANVYRSIKK